MNDKEFEQLRSTIQSLMLFLNDLQKLHREQTGKDFVISGPVDELSDVLLDGLNRIGSKLDALLKNQGGYWFPPPHKTAKEITNAED